MSQVKVVSNRFHGNENDFSVLWWPFKKPDLNLVEHLWDVIQDVHIMEVNLKNLRLNQDKSSSLGTMGIHKTT